MLAFAEPAHQRDDRLLHLNNARNDTACRLPGADYIEAGVTDLVRGVESVPALLVAIGAPRTKYSISRSSSSSSGGGGGGGSPDVPSH
jgi:hypothetical protein